MIVRAAPRLVPAAAGAWLRWRGYTWAVHLAKHGTPLAQIVRAIIFGERFRYFHQGASKVGFFLVDIGLFVATSQDKFILTAFVPNSPRDYVSRLKAVACP